MSDEKIELTPTDIKKRAALLFYGEDLDDDDISSHWLEEHGGCGFSTSMTRKELAVPVEERDEHLLRWVGECTTLSELHAWRHAKEPEMHDHVHEPAGE